MTQKRLNAEDVEQARAIDLEILRQYDRKNVLVDTPSRTYAGFVSNIGLNFFVLKNVRNYYDNNIVRLSNLNYERNPLENYEPVPDLTISTSLIEQIVLFSDLQERWALKERREELMRKEYFK